MGKALRRRTRVSSRRTRRSDSEPTARCLSCGLEPATKKIAWFGEARYCASCVGYVHYHAEPPDSRIVYGARLVGEAAEQATFDVRGSGSTSTASKRREKRVEREFSAFLSRYIAGTPCPHGSLRVARPSTCVGPDDRRTTPDLCLKIGGSDIAIEIKAVDDRGPNENAEMSRGIGQAVAYGWSNIHYSEDRDRYRAVILLVVRFIRTPKSSMCAIEKLAVQADTDGRNFVLYYLRRDVVVPASR